MWLSNKNTRKCINMIYMSFYNLSNISNSKNYAENSSSNHAVVNMIIIKSWKSLSLLNKLFNTPFMDGWQNDGN